MPMAQHLAVPLAQVLHSFNCPVQWSLKIPAVCDETNDPIHMKVLNSENYHGCRYRGHPHNYSMIHA